MSPEKEKPRFAVIAITGSMGSGKSEAAGWFQQKGYQTVSADEIGHQLLREPDVIKQLRESFGEDILNGGEIDRKKLADEVFSNKQKLKTLNEILHPLIIQRIRDMIRNQASYPLIFEIPLLFETSIEELFDLTINISATESNRKQRLIQAGRLNNAEIARRFETQLPDEVKRERADITVENDCRKECLYNQLEIIHKSFAFFTAGKRNGHEDKKYRHTSE